MKSLRQQQAEFEASVAKQKAELMAYMNPQKIGVDFSPSDYDIYAYCEGLEFAAWIDADSRDNGYNEGGLIENPAYVIESLFRDWIFAERGLSLKTETSDTEWVVQDISNSTDDYYNGAYVINLSQGSVADQMTEITDYDGSSNTITVADSETNWAEGDLVVIANIQGSNRIDYANFDGIGNTSTGTRHGWVFRRSINGMINARTLLEEALIESFMILGRSQGKYKLFTLDATGGSVDTWSVPLKRNGREIVGGSLTPLTSIYSDYRLNYGYNYARQKYEGIIRVDKATYTSTLSNGSDLKTYCANAETNYRVANKFEINCNWIADETTADNLLNKLVGWYKKQRLVVTWAGTIKDYIKYEIGDQVKINYPSLIPAALNNSSKFLIYNKQVAIRDGDPYVQFGLIELG